LKIITNFIDSAHIKVIYTVSRVYTSNAGMLFKGVKESEVVA
jgi:hypothetical protein